MSDTNLIFPEQFWAGTQLSLDMARAALSRMMSGPFDQTKPAEDAPYNFSMQGNIGVVSVRGSLVNNNSQYNKYFGVTSYNDIRSAMLYAAEQGASSTLLDITSGGGAVSGVSDMADFIANFDANVMPVYTFTDGTMASAAYWLGSSARNVFASKTAMVGSIGVIMTHMEQSKMLEKMGITVNVIRAGEHKALLNSYEPATQAALDNAAVQLAHVYDIFVSHVADSRGVSFQHADRVMGQGREFIGQQAADAGLVDAISTFDKVVGMIQATHP